MYVDSKKDTLKQKMHRNRLRILYNLYVCLSVDQTHFFTIPSFILEKFATNYGADECNNITNGSRIFPASPISVLLPMYTRAQWASSTQTVTHRS